MVFVVKAALFVLALWAAIVAVMALMQGAILFPRAMVGPAPALPQTTKRFQITRPDGATLQGVLIPGQNSDIPLVLGFGGNAWNAESVALFLHQHLPQHPVAAFHYRGYAPSTGTPSAKALMADAEALHDLLYEAGYAQQIAIGFSIGSGVAAHLVTKRPVMGAVLVTPFDSLGAVARQALPWAPVRFLFRHEMDAGTALQGTQHPIALILATRDEVIAPARAKALVSALEAGPRAPVFTARIPAGHNDIYANPEFGPAMRAAVAAIQD